MVTLRSRLAESARSIKPLRQGDLDGLCGLYAIINAIRLVVLPFRELSRRELKYLFDRGAGVLTQRRQLRRVLGRGMRHALWAQLCEELVFEAGQLTGLELFAAPLFKDGVEVSDRDALRAIRAGLRDGWPVLVALMDSYDHTSVIVGYSRARLNLFDSWDFRWTRIASISFDPAKPGKPHFIPPESLVAVLAF